MRYIYLIVLLFIFSSEALSAPIEINGGFRIRGEGNHRTDFANNRDFFSFRLRPRFTLTEEKFKIVFTPQFARVMGEPAVGQITSGSTLDPCLGVHETYLTYKISERFSLTAGRMILSYGDELVIGALEWNNIARAFDGFKMQFIGDKSKFDLFATKIQENNNVTQSTRDTDFAGAYLTLSPNEYLKELDFYTLYASNMGNNFKQLGAAGVRVKSKVSSVDYRAEATKEFGNGTFGNDAYQVDAETGYHLGGTIEPRIALGGFHAGADYFQFYPTVHKWLGFADVLGRRNLSGFVIRGSLKPAPKLKLSADYHLFSRVSTRSPAYLLNGTSPLGQTSRSTSKDLGSEIDVTIMYTIDSNIFLSGGASVFLPGSYLKEQFGSSLPTFAFTQLEVTF